MRRFHPNRLILAVGVVFGLVALQATGLDAELLVDLERLHEADQHEQIIRVIDRELAQLSDPNDRARLLWRKTRAELTIADHQRWVGNLTDRETIVLLEEAAAHADRAIEIAPDLADPYFWKGATIGLQGQIRGVLNSLFMASSLRDYAEKTLERDPEHAEAHYLLGQLYRELPRWPISFGDRERAVRYGRRSIELHERAYASGGVGVRYYDFYTQLAASLWRRNSRGDRDEARRVLRDNLERLEALSSPTNRQRMDLESARELLTGWS
ncbi:MAG: hypothetical protein EA382_05970 [Spirochaetaceae bacterium]|nr:MAG: hypothetical protein EA382_05970 [Spirochaetaceae bacterium]